MIDADISIHENKQWQRDHALWSQEVRFWQHETERLVAMLYLIERAIPDHASLLDQHISMVDKHEQRIISYECCGIDRYCLETSPDYKTLKQQLCCHDELSKVHEQMRLEHQKIKELYSTEMKRFRTLLLKLLEESESLFND